MTNPPEDSKSGHWRASDQDRERVAEVLRDAAGDGRIGMDELQERLEALYAAKTYAELEPITADLPPTGAVSRPVAAPATSSPDRFGGEPSGGTAVAVLSSFERRGAWVVPSQFSAMTVLGSGEIDLREARFAERTVTIHAVSVLGSIEIFVPDDADVRVNGIGCLGEFTDEATGTGQPGGPTIIVSGMACLGMVVVVRRPKGERREERPYTPRDRLEDRRERLEARRERLEMRLEDKRHRRESRWDRRLDR